MTDGIIAVKGNVSATFQYKEKKFHACIEMCGK